MTDDFLLNFLKLTKEDIRKYTKAYTGCNFFREHTKCINSINRNYRNYL